MCGSSLPTLKPLDNLLQEASVPRLGLRELDLDTEYRTGERDLMGEFYRPCLSRSIRYDRAVGYFRSTIFAIAGDAAIEFARRGGQIRFVCSPVLSEEDINALGRGYDQREQVIERLMLAEVDALLSDARFARPAELLATLIALGVLDLRVAIRPPQHGIYHEKLGIFSDAYGDAVSFKGSSNETWNAWHEQGNLESFETFCSWTDDFRRVARHRGYFERLWAGQLESVSVVPFPEAARERLCEIAKDDVADLPTGEKRATAERKVPLPHQRLAIENWIAAGERGILQHATGSGKTITALTIIQRHLEAGRPAIVVVPSTLLLEQWHKELTSQIPEAVVLLAGGNHDAWRRPNRLESFSADDAEVGPRVVLSTMQTASKPEFRSRLRQGSHLLLVADEVHQIGSVSNAQILQIDAGARLGLSATPTRFGDEDGTARILSYFGPVVPPIVTLADAIRSGRLVPYEYHAHPIQLTAAESDAWKTLTERITREAARSPRGDSGEPLFSERVKLLLIQRARIAKKAVNKITLARAIVTAEFRAGQRWLVYCEDLEQLGLVLAELTNAGLPATEYYSEMSGDRVAALDWLRRFGGIVVSVRCLDEGVDIPEVSHALILASSQNPRQFIQRRGRVLRTAPDKYMAVIHDALVIPPSVALEPEQAALARAEIARALEFATSAINRIGAEQIASLADQLGITIEMFTTTGLEDQHELSDS